MKSNASNPGETYAVLPCGHTRVDHLIEQVLIISGESGVPVAEEHRSLLNTLALVSLTTNAETSEYAAVMLSEAMHAAALKALPDGATADDVLRFLAEATVEGMEARKNRVLT